MPTDTSGPRGMKWSSLVVRRSKIKVTRDDQVSTKPKRLGGQVEALFLGRVAVLVVMMSQTSAILCTIVISTQPIANQPMHAAQCTASRWNLANDAFLQPFFTTGKQSQTHMQQVFDISPHSSSTN